MEKKQNTNNRNQDKTDNRLNQTTNPDRTKKETDPNNPVASMDKKNDSVKVNGFKQSEAISDRFKSKQGVKNNAQIDKVENDVNDGDNDEDDDEGEVIVNKKSSSKIVDSKQNQHKSEIPQARK